MTEMVDVPAPRQYHDDWDDWEAYFKVYCAMTHQKIKIEETKKREWRLARIYESKVYQDLAEQNREDEYPVPPENFDIFQRTYVCTHGGADRKSRGKSVRVRRYLRHYGCPFRFVVQVVQRSDSSWCLEARLGVFEHNHSVDRQVFRTYPDQRGVMIEDNAQMVQTMVDVRAKRSKIYDFLLNQGENVIKSDVDNIIAQRRSRMSTADDNEATAIQLAELTADDPNNLVTVDESHRGHSAVISITTSLMRAQYARFPEMILVDCTHKTNRYNYQLCTFMVIDEHGEGVVVQHSLFETNSDWHMEAALAHFMRANHSAKSALRVIMVDKDLNEIRVLRSQFPEARVLICTFHVIKYFSVVVKKPEYGTISAEDRTSVEHLLRNLVYAPSADVYAQERQSLKLLCKRVHFTDFFDYYERNWDSCQEMWVKYLRDKLPYFRVNTNNHLESFFGKLKDSLTSNVTMAECLKELVVKERLRQNDHNYMNSRVGTYVNRNYDEELATVLRFTTHFVADNVAKEYDIGRTKATEYTYVEVGDVFKVQGVKHSHEVNRHTWVCTCEFAVGMKLPCRHSVAVRIYHKMKPVIPLERIAIRWNRLQAPVPRVRQFKYNAYMPPPEHAPSQRSARERYREVMRQLQPLCTEIAEISDDDEFGKAIQFVQDAWMNARMRKRVKLNEEEDQQQDNEEDETSDLEPPTQPSAGISLTQNSLFSEEIGSVAVVDTRSISIPEPVSVLALSQSQQGKDEGKSEDDGDFEQLDQGLKINLNPRAARPGRPKSSRAQDEAESRQGRRVFKETITARRALGEIAMRQLLESLDKEQPELADLKRRLDSITVRHLEHERSKVELVKKPLSTMVNDPFYVLPSPTLDKCFIVLPLSNDAEDAISLYSQTYSQEPPNPSATVEGVKIGSGRNTVFFSRTTIEVMQRVTLLKKAAVDGLAFVRWLEREVASAVPSAQQKEVQDMAKQVAARYPTGTLEGFNSDFQAAMLPLLKPPAWFNDGIIRAFCERLSQAWPNFKATRVLLLDDPDKKRTRSNTLTPYKLTSEVESAIEDYDSDESVQEIGIPVCFANQHWCCMIVSKTRRLISTYDSLGGSKTQTVMGCLAEKIQNIVSDKTMAVQRVQSPVQSDGFSCGFFVCYKLWRQLDASASRDLSANGQLSLRFQLLKFIVGDSFAAQREND